MSKFDQGKHIIGHDESGAPIKSLKRLDAQRPPAKLEERQSAFEITSKSVDSKLRGGFHKPGSQNRNK